MTTTQNILLARGFCLKDPTNILKSGAYVENPAFGGNPERWFPGVSFGLLNLEGLGFFEDFARRSAEVRREQPLVIQIDLSERLFHRYKHGIYVIGYDPKLGRDEGKHPEFLEDIFKGVTINLPEELLSTENLFALKTRIGLANREGKFLYQQMEEFLESREGKPRLLT